MPALSKSGGYATFLDPDGKSFNGLSEYDTRTCQHHGGLVRFAGFERLQDKGAICSRCGGFICLQCQAEGGCIPIDDRLTAWETAAGTPQAIDCAAAEAEQKRHFILSTEPTAANGYLLLPEGFTPKRRP